MAAAAAWPRGSFQEEDGEMESKGLLARESQEHVASPTVGLEPDGVTLSDLRSFIMDPAPRGRGMVLCQLERNGTGLGKLFPKYTLTTESGTPLLVAQKRMQQKSPNYSISLPPGCCGGNDEKALLGKLRANFVGVDFVAYDAGLNPKKIDPSLPRPQAEELARQELVTVAYDSTFFGSSQATSARRMHVLIPKVQPSGERFVCRPMKADTEGLRELQAAGGAGELLDYYFTKEPTYDPQTGGAVLNFNKRVSLGSIKNFQLTSKAEPDTVFVQFGKNGKSNFILDVRYPFSIFQAFAVALSTFESKLCCE